MTTRIVVIYSYYEKNRDYIDNLKYFIQHALYDDIHYIFCINGRKCSVEIPTSPNIEILERDNHDYDFGAYSDALKNIDISSYDYFFFINTSVCGPFLRENIRWTQPFLDLLTDNVKLVGTTINICDVRDPETQKKGCLDILVEKGYKPPFSHVQSQVFVLDNEALRYIISQGLFDQSSEKDFVRFVVLREILLSQLILRNGWNINCILPKYKGIDYRIITRDINWTTLNGDAYYPGRYFGGSIKPYDVIFIKTNRNLYTYVNPSSLKIYVICHDDKSEQRAIKLVEDKPWAVPTRIKTTVFLETNFWNEYDASSDTQEWVGTISYHADDKILDPLGNLGKAMKEGGDDIDVIGLLNAERTMLSLAHQAVIRHPGLLQLMEIFLSKAGESKEDIAKLSSNEMKPFYANFWIARREWAKSYSEWLRRVLPKSAEVEKLLWMNSGYEISKLKTNNNTMQMFGCSYYPMHPFLGERLPIYYYHTRKARVTVIKHRPALNKKKI